MDKQNYFLGIFVASFLLAPWWLSAIIGLSILILFEKHAFILFFAVVTDLVFMPEFLSVIYFPTTLLVLFVIVAIGLLKRKLWVVVN